MGGQKWGLLFAGPVFKLQKIGGTEMSEVLKLKKSNCKNCYRCIRHCPVKSIRFSDGQANIINDKCILCGQCFVECPQNAKQIVDSTAAVKRLVSEEGTVVASVAPSFAAYFEGVGFSALDEALRYLGFSFAEETAIGATIVKREYEKQAAQHKGDIIITSCCHSVNLLIRKYYPELIDCLSPVVSPMIAHSIDIKNRYPGAKTVFIGPCVSKKDEAENSPVDAVLTFEELSKMFLEKGVFPSHETDSNEKSRARLFPTVGGILKTMDIPKNSEYTYITVDGTENCRKALDDISAGNIHNCFIEMSACSGSCVGGPIMEKYKDAPIRHYKAVTSYAGKEDFEVAGQESGKFERVHTKIEMDDRIPTEFEIEEILRKLGKTKPEDELNCGTCGYNTCREKAVAVYQGKASLNMCLPYLMEKTQSFSDTILNNSPNGIVAVNENYDIQEINRAAMRMLRVANRKDVIGEQVVRVLNPWPFMDVLMNGKVIRDERDYYAEFDKYFSLSIVHDRTSHLLIAIIHDVTDEEQQRRRKEEIGRKTVEIADAVVEKQMRIVQEIASLLGETTAETKIALTKLKESIENEDER